MLMFHCTEPSEQSNTGRVIGKTRLLAAEGSDTEVTTWAAATKG